MSDYLAGENEPTERIRCPVHGFVHYSRNERKLIDHWTFQRLRNIRQLAMEYLVYPGAVHTRFEHSLGVMEMTTRVFDHLLSRHRSAIEQDLRQVPELTDNTIAKARQLTRVLGLLHDVGHSAFAHAGEQGIPGRNHERVSIFVIDRLLRDTLDSIFFSGRIGYLSSAHGEVS